MSNRIKLVDIAKGISIIIVAFGHSHLGTLLPDANDAMALFRMPLFFFLSGVFFSTSSKPTDFILNKTDALLKPYFVTLFVVLLVSISSGDNNVISHINGIFYGNGDTIRWSPLWFLTHLWLLFVVSYFLFYYTKLGSKSKLVKIFTVIFLLIIGSIFVNHFWYISVSIFGKKVQLPGLPFSIDIIFLSIAFFISGNFLSHRVRNFEPRIEALLGAILIFASVAINTEAEVSLNTRVYNEPLFATFAAIAGIYIILSISYYLCKNKLLTIIFTTFGASSLFILIFHSYIIFSTHRNLSSLYAFDSQFVYATLSFIVGIVVPVFLRKLMLKNEFIMLFYLPLKSNQLFYQIRTSYQKYWHFILVKNGRKSIWKILNYFTELK